VKLKATGLLSGLGVLSLALATAQADGPVTAPRTDAPAAAPATTPQGGGELQTGPATIPPHWSRYQCPDTIPEGATYYIIVRGDTLWDIAGRFLGNPFLWPQIWDANRCITDAHWIYPGDPLIMPSVALVSDQAGQAGEGQAGAGEGEGEQPPVPGAAAGDVLVPAIEEMALQCAHYILQEPEDTSLYVVGSEQGSDKNAFGDRDMLYLNRGTSAGVKAGDLYTLHHASYEVKHPDSGRTIGRKIETTGWGRVILAEENSAILMVEAACEDVHLGDYLKPLVKVSVPLIMRRPPADRLTPPTGKTQGAVVDIGQDSVIAGENQLVSINLGTEHGIAPGNIFTVFKTMYPSVPTPRNVLGEIVIVSVQEKTATARVIYSGAEIMNGDRVELH
jgi:LysM domain